MTKKKLNKVVLKTIKSHIKEQKQLQKSLLREANISYK